MYDFMRFQEDVSHVTCVLPKIRPEPKVFGTYRHRTGGQQTVPVRVPQVFVAGRGQGRSSGPAPAIHAPRLTVYGRSAAQNVRVVRKSQTHQQRNGHQWTGKRANLSKFIFSSSTYMQCFELHP